MNTKFRIVKDNGIQIEAAVVTCPIEAKIILFSFFDEMIEEGFVPGVCNNKGDLGEQVFIKDGQERIVSIRKVETFPVGVRGVIKFRYPGQVTEEDYLLEALGRFA